MLICPTGRMFEFIMNIFHFQDIHVTVATSGNNHVILCDLTGWAHLISRSWEITSFKAYELTITHAQQLPHDPLLVTIGVNNFNFLLK